MATTSISLAKKFRKHWQFFVYLFFGIFLRFWNFHNSLYFIYDQGRDAVTFQKIAAGHLVLVGPTSGLSGFFLGPLWFYLGMPGYFLSGGNPYGICLWYIAISCLALPLFWILAHKLFPQKFWAMVCAVFLAIIPGSIQASIFVWNPLMSVPMMTGALLCLMQTRTEKKSVKEEASTRGRIWLMFGFFLLALTLQSEFAYAVFFLPPLFLLIPWLRGKIDWRDFAAVILAAGATFLPQGLFELRNHFIMTTSLLHSMGDSSQSVPWAQLFAMRPTQLLATTTEFFFGPGKANPFTESAVVLPCLLALFFILQNWRAKKSPWQLLLLFAVLPYPFFLIWRGNHGYFFSYYITAHFVFLVPLFVYGLQHIIAVAKKNVYLQWAAKCIAAVIFLAVILASWSNWKNTVLQPENNAGLAKIMIAVAQIYDWQKQDDVAQATVRIYTANVYTEQYDYVFGWYARAHHLSAPVTVRTGNEKIWYVFIESKEHAQSIFFDPWYAAATAGGTKVREQHIGVLTLETWQKQ
jgi:hypothetical protein